MIGESVTVWRPSSSSVDANGNAVVSWASEQVSDVLVGPGPRADLSEAERPNGFRVVFNLHFPKTFVQSLVGCEITVRGSRLAVVGSPEPYTDANTPTRWNRPVEVWRVDG